MGLRPSVKNDDEGSHRIPHGSGNDNGNRSKNKDGNFFSINQNESNLSPNLNHDPPAPSSSPSSSSPHQHQQHSQQQQSPPPNPPQREAWTARGKLLLNFHHVISRAINSPEMLKKCSQIAAQMSEEEEEAFHGGYSNAASSSSSTDDIVAQEYSAEAALIVENKSKRDAQVRNKSLALGVFTFASLRSVPWVRRSITTWFHNWKLARSNYKFDRLPTTTTTTTNLSTLSSSSASSGSKKLAGSNNYYSKLMSQNKILHAQQQTNNHGITTVAQKQQPKSIFQKSLRLAFDVSFSTSIAFLSGTFLFLPRPSAYMEDMSKLPLVEGKSVYAEVVCPPLIMEYKKVLEQYGGRWPVGNNGNNSKSNNGERKGATAMANSRNGSITQEDVSLNIIRKFVENCSKRSKYERALLEEREALNTNTIGSSNGFQNYLMDKFKGNAHPMDNDGTIENVDNGSSNSSISILNSQSPVKLGTVVVPSPGVPDDIVINLDQEVLYSDYDLKKKDCAAAYGPCGKQQRQQQ